MWGPTQNLSPIGSAVLTFIGYQQTNKETDKPNLYIDIECWMEHEDCQSKITLLLRGDFKIDIYIT